MPTRSQPPVSRHLPAHPNLRQLKKQAKELHRAYCDGQAAAVAEVQRYERASDPGTFSLVDAQRVLARACGFASWTKLTQHVDGLTVDRFCDAAERGAIQTLRDLLAARPELVHMERAGNNEHTALHYAVLKRNPEATRLLLEAGADPHKGIYPHRDATAPLTLAMERGFDEIVDLIKAELDRRRQEVGSTHSEIHLLREAIRAGRNDEALQLLEADRSLIEARDEEGRQPLHTAAACRNQALTECLLQHHAEVSSPDASGVPPLDCAVLSVGWTQRQETGAAVAVAGLLMSNGAKLTLRAAVALGDLDHLRQVQQREPDQLNAYRDGREGLLTLAVKFGQFEVLAFLLGAGLDPDERQQLENLEEETYTWGMPLWHAAAYSEYSMAELLIERGADVDAMVYASGPPMERAYGARDEEMKALLRRHGAVTSVEVIGLNRDTRAARNVVEGRAVAHTDRTETTQIEQLLWAGACGGEPEIVQLCLPHIERPLDDAWWNGILQQPMRIWNHGPHDQNKQFERSTYPRCLELLLDHGVDADVTNHHGFTMLQHLAQAGVTWGQPIMTELERIAFGRLLLDAGASLTVRDPLLRSTPLAWAYRWNRRELIELLIARGAPVDEPDAEPWATPLAWAAKLGHDDLADLLRGRGAVV